MKSKFMMLAVLCAVCSCRADLDSTPQTSATKIVFEDPPALEVLMAFMGDAGVRPAEFTFRVGESMRGGFRFNADESLDAGLQRFRRLHAEFLAAAIADAETHAEDRSDRWRNFVVFLEDSNASPQVWIEETVMGTREDALVVQDLFGGIATENPSVDEEVVPDRIVYSTSHESWAPYGGTAKLTQGVSYHTFYFNNLSAYGSTSTYEHEAQVYNRAYADYAGYWSSNLPYAYYDTPFSDSIDVFTVGSAQAASMATYTQYYTYMALSPGLATSATVRVKGQLGHRSPSWCYSTWCIFADATTGSMTTFLAPVEGISWSY